MLEFIKKLLGNSNDTQLKKLRKTVDAVNALEKEYRAMTDAQLRAKTDEFRARLEKERAEKEAKPNG